ncbi:MAG: flagellar hook capping protein [Deltaproteobacteria bacterium]|nr:MAG: flagellar hook capping protein [Deltaproteobacteria bacterium]
MRVAPTPSSPPSPAGTAAPAPTAKDEFLRLLVAQLEHQNPLDPQDGAEFVAQLAQFANVEQGAQATAILSQIQAEQRAAAGAALAGFVGATATASADAVHWAPDGGAPPDLFVDLPDAAESVQVVIRDANGNEVKSIDLGPHPAGDVSIGWDGTDAQGVPVDEGTYTVEVVATAADGSSIDASPKLRGRVDAIEFSDGVHMLRIGGASVPPASVLSIERDA